MTDWVHVKNFYSLMDDYQKNDYGGKTSPGLATYLNKIIEQNEQIITLLIQLKSKM